MSGVYSPRVADTSPLRRCGDAEPKGEVGSRANNWTNFSFNNFDENVEVSPSADLEDNPFDEPGVLPTSNRSAPLPSPTSSYHQHSLASEAIYDPPETPFKDRSPSVIHSVRSGEGPQRKSRSSSTPSPPHQISTHRPELSVVYHPRPAPILEPLTPQSIKKSDSFLEEGMQFTWDQTQTSQSHGSTGKDAQFDEDDEESEAVYGKQYSSWCGCFNQSPGRCCWVTLAILWLGLIIFLGLIIGAAARGDSLTPSNIFSTGDSTSASEAIPPQMPGFTTAVPTVAPFTTVPTCKPVKVVPKGEQAATPSEVMFPTPMPIVATATDAPVIAPISTTEVPISDPPVSVPTEAPVAAPIGLPFPTDSAFTGPPPSNITVGAYYYPWHADDFHGGKYLREQLQPHQEPVLGEYDDRNNEVIAQHLAWSRQANIGVWITSWWGPGRREDETTKNFILNHPDLRDHKIALHYETTGRIREDENFTTHRVASDIDYIAETYFKHPNYYRIEGRPVLVMYLTRKLERTGKMEEVILLIKSVAKFHGFDIYLIGDHIWQDAPSGDELYRPFLYLDGVTNYDVYGSMGRTGYATQSIVDKYYSTQREWREQANLKRCGYIPGVTPGFNDRAVRLRTDHNPLSRKLSWDDAPGSLFRASLEKARYLVDESAGNLMIVNSFNEWHEDTQIEPTVGETTNLPYTFTRGLEYSGYGTLYLDILREATIDRATVVTGASTDDETVVAVQTARLVVGN